MNEVQFSDMTRFWSSEQILKHVEVDIAWCYVGFPRPISVGSGQWSGWELDVHHGQCSGWELDIHWVWVFSAAFSEGNQTWGGLMCLISRYLKENVSVCGFSSLYVFLSARMPSVKCWNGTACVFLINIPLAMTKTTNQFSDRTLIHDTLNPWTTLTLW